MVDVTARTNKEKLLEKLGDSYRYAREYRERMRATQGVERLTPSHPDAKLAAIAADFEAMTARPIARRFLRAKPELLLEEADHVPAPERLPEEAAIPPKTVLITRKSVEVLSRNQLKAAMAHELGHLLACDRHFRDDGTSKRKAELLADKISVLLSGDPEAVRNGLTASIEEMRRVGEETESIPIQQSYHRNLTGDHEYPSLAVRLKKMDEAGKLLATEDGRKKLEKDILFRLISRHRQFFAHQYERDTTRFPHTR